MYTIYINDSPLRLVENAQLQGPELKLRYFGGPKFLLQLIGTLEGGNHPEGAMLVCPNLEDAWKDFQSMYNIVSAAGGAVFNDGRLLCIYRRGSWDLPKGKIDDGESQDEAALREVEEETGLKTLSLGEQLPTTYHTYKTKKGKRILKPTYWYKMTSQQEELVPQEEEDIVEARWVPVDDLPAIKAKMYKSLHGVVESAY